MHSLLLPFDLLDWHQSPPDRIDVFEETRSGSQSVQVSKMQRIKKEALREIQKLKGDSGMIW